jgi:hypothetical protein
MKRVISLENEVHWARLIYTYEPSDINSILKFIKIEVDKQWPTGILIIFKQERLIPEYCSTSLLCIRDALRFV